MKKSFTRSILTEDGQAMTEYVLILLFIAIAVMIGLSNMGTSFRDFYERFGSYIQSSV